MQQEKASRDWEDIKLVKKRITKLYEDVVKYIEQRREFSDEELVSNGRQTKATISDYRNTASNLEQVEARFIASILGAVILIVLTVLNMAGYLGLDLQQTGHITSNVVLCISEGYCLIKVAICKLDKVMIEKLQIKNEDLQAVCKSSDRI